MSQAADALGKMAQMLGVPPTALWGMVPGVEKTDVAEWVRLAEEGDPITKMQERLARQRMSAEVAAKAAAAPPRQNGQRPARPASDGVNA